MNIPPRRKPDVIIGDSEPPYLLRWYLIPRNPVFNIYLHCFLRSDDDRALHDHPWANMSILLRGQYVEHTIEQGGVHRRRLFGPGDWRFRWRGSLAHRLELIGAECWTIFITGPKYRQWGFHCPEAGWMHWKKFTKTEGNVSSIDKGCN